jgi:hypothetical protein
MQKSKHPEHFFLIIYLVYLLDKTKVHNGLPTKVQSIKRKKIEQWYINFPAAIAQAMEFERCKTVSGSSRIRDPLVLRRQKVPSCTKKIGRMTRTHR